MNIFEKVIEKNKSPLSIFKNMIDRTEAENGLIDIANYIENLDSENKRMHNLINTWNQDKEIQKLKDELQELQSKQRRHVNYAITDEELTSCYEWEEKHVEEKHKGKECGAIGGRFTYELTPTSIGICGAVRCNCGDRFEFRELG